MGKCVIIASNNEHKVHEITHALNFEGWEYRSLKESHLTSQPDETGTTFEENARIKAQAVHNLSGKAALADDSGLVVDALNGAPGVYSSRYSGIEGDDAANNAKLLQELQDVPEPDRTARFVCTLVFIDEDGSETVASGTIEGKIGFSAKGENGFGYDPLFIPDCFGDTRTLAEVDEAEKNSVSHRGNALRELKKILSADKTTPRP